MRRGMEDGHSHAPHDFPSLPPSSSPMLLSSLRARKALQDEGRQNGTYQTTKRWTATFCRYNVTVCLAPATRDPASENRRELF